MTHAFVRRHLLFLAAAMALVLALLSPSRADEKDNDRKKGVPPVLRWGADFSGGEPYVIGNPGRNTAGFEGELAQYLAKRLGVPCESRQGAWESLPLLLNNNKEIDLVLNGYEWTPEREEEMLSTIPYY